MCFHKLLAILCGLAVSAGLFAGDAARAGKSAQPRVDLWGDPLPPGALARLGTIRYRLEAPIKGGGIGILADSKTVVIGTPGSHKFQLMDSDTGKVVREISTGDIDIHDFTVLSNGESIAAIGELAEKEDLTRPFVLGIFDAASGKMLRTRNSKDFGDVGQLANLVGKLAIISVDGKLFFSINKASLLRIHDLATGAELQRHQFLPGIPGLAISADGSTVAIAMGFNSQRLFLWKWKDPGEPREIKVPAGGGGNLTLAPDGKALAETSIAEAIIRVWDVASGQLLHELVPPDGFMIKPVAFTPNGKTVVAVVHSRDFSSAVHFWDAATGKHQHQLAGPAVSVLVSPDSKRLVATNGGSLRVWEWGTWKELSASAEGHEDGVECVFFKGNMVISHDRHSIRVWDAGTAKQRFTLARGYQAFGPGTSLSPDGTKLAYVSRDDSVRLWDVTTGKLIHKLAGHGVNARGVTGFTADGKHFMSSGWDNILGKYDVATGNEVLEHKMPKGLKSLEYGNFSPDGSLSIRDANNEFHIFDVSSGKELMRVGKEPVMAKSYAVSPDGKSLLASLPGSALTKKLPNGKALAYPEKQNSLVLWELATKQARKTFTFPNGGAGTVAFSPDGKHFAVAVNGPESRVHIYEMADAKEIAVIEGYRGTVHSLAFAEDGQRLATGMSDTTVLLWDVAPFKK